MIFVVCALHLGAISTAAVVVGRLVEADFSAASNRCADVDCDIPTCDDGLELVYGLSCCPECRRFGKPKYLTTGVCATSPELPCCAAYLSSYLSSSQPGPRRADLSDYPKCDADGYFKPKQSYGGEVGTLCVDKNGNSHSSQNDWRTRTVRAFLVCPQSTSASCPMTCTMEFQPVCDSDGKTHLNKCGFEVAACQARELGHNLRFIKELAPVNEEQRSQMRPCNRE